MGHSGASKKTVSTYLEGSGLAAIAAGIGQGLQSAATYSAKAASRANSVSAASQAAQGAFNQASANNANAIAQQRIADQYAYNAAQAASANDFTQSMWNQSAEWNQNMWDQTASWNEEMWQRQADFNAAEAQKNRDWQEKMLNTQYQRAIKDMEKAGLNPILAATHGINTGIGGSSAASVGGASMSPSSMSGSNGYAASGGLMNGISASEGNYTGQMEYMGGMLGLLAAAFSGISSAMGAMQQMGVTQNSDFLKFLNSVLTGNKSNLTYRYNHSKGGSAINGLKRTFRELTGKE